MNVFELGARINMDTSGYEKSLSSASTKTNDFASKMGGALKTAAQVGTVAIASAAAGIAALGKIGFDYNSDMETYTTNFETMLGSTELAVEKVEELKKFAASTPLSMSDLAQATQTLLAFGVESESSTGILRALGDVALGDSAKLQSLATAFGKAKAQGKLTGEVVQSMISAGWNPLVEITKMTGESMEEVQKRMSEGKISITELELALKHATTEGGQFEGGMERASKTTKGLMSTMEDNARSLIGAVFEPVSESMRTEVLPTAIDSIARLTTAFEEGGVDGMIQAGGEIMGELLAKISERLPDMINMAIRIVNSILQGITDNLPKITQAALTIVLQLTTAIIEDLPKILNAGVTVIAQLVQGIADALPTLIPAAIGAISQIVVGLTDPEAFGKLVDAALAIITELGIGLVDNIPTLLQDVPKIITNIVTCLTENLPKLSAAALNIVVKLVTSIIENMPKLVAAGLNIINSLIGGIGEYLHFLKEYWAGVISDWFTVDEDGKTKISGMVNDIVQKLIDSLAQVWHLVTDWWIGVFAKLFKLDETQVANLSQMASDIIENIKTSISNAWNSVVQWWDNLWSGLFGGGNEVNVDVNTNVHEGDGYSGRSGKYASGTPYVQNDEIAQLHRGELVMNAKDAAEYRRGGNGNQTAADQNIAITMPIMLDGRQIGETSYNYSSRRERAAGA